MEVKVFVAFHGIKRFHMMIEQALHKQLNERLINKNTIFFAKSDRIATCSL